MAKLTITIDDELLNRARLRAFERNTCVDALLREYLEAFAGDRSGTARKRFSAIARAATSSSGDKGRTWSRDELHER